MDMMHQVRKALNDITTSFADGDSDRAELQVHWLRRMIDEPTSRQKPWKDYRAMIDEEYEQ